MQSACSTKGSPLEHRFMKEFKLVLCLVALPNILTGPLLDSSYGTIRLSKPFATIDTTNCVPNSPTVWFASVTGDSSNDGKTPQTPMTVYSAAQAALPGHRICDGRNLCRNGDFLSSAKRDALRMDRIPGLW